LDKSLKSIEARITQTDKESLSFLIHNSLFIIPLIGKFNIYNSLAAICVGMSQGVNLETCRKALEKVKIIPGRMEIVIKKPFQVIVDYAHTPDALEKVYKNLKSVHFQQKEARLICVLGSCGGGRDKWKRPKMGEIAVKYCDEIILTNEDPYDENPQKIIEDIENGVLKIKNSKFIQNSKATLQGVPNFVRPSKIQNYQKILDRREAIRKALTLASANNIVIITGKGSEPWMCVGKGRRIVWDDREVVKSELKLLNRP